MALVSVLPEGEEQSVVMEKKEQPRKFFHFASPTPNPAVKMTKMQMFFHFSNTIEWLKTRLLMNGGGNVERAWHGLDTLGRLFFRAFERKARRMKTVSLLFLFLFFQLPAYTSQQLRFALSPPLNQNNRQQSRWFGTRFLLKSLWNQFNQLMSCERGEERRLWVSDV